ncbi:MAG: YggS family pyridoxal phosphate enzyme, partial [Halanaerobiales bacterium]
MNQKAIAERLDDIKNKIKQAAVKSNRDYQDIQLIAVSKNHSYKKINFFKDQGQIIFGESRVQELRKKNEKVNNVDWHFIGHLQRNKVKYLMRMESCKLIHSV